MLKVNPSATVAVSVTLTKKYFFTLEQHEQLGNTGKKKQVLFVHVYWSATDCMSGFYLFTFAYVVQYFHQATCLQLSKTRYFLSMRLG